MFPRLIFIWLLLVCSVYGDDEGTRAYSPCYRQKEIKPYLLPAHHPLKVPLDQIFFHSNVLKNVQTFANAGFETLHVRANSYICIAKHPLLPGYLVKAYLDDEIRWKDGIPGWKWLVNRCKGAENIRKLIRKKNLNHFVVPDKWLYPLPNGSQQPVILIVTDMDLASRAETRRAWKTRVTEEHLDELFCILRHGYASCDIVNNIPYTKTGKFACIDTEHPKRKLKYEGVKNSFSEKMKSYWETLMNKRN
jgi:hypothetical protein